jgi:hypothetical protein
MAHCHQYALIEHQDQIPSRVLQGDDFLQKPWLLFSFNYLIGKPDVGFAPPTPEGWLLYKIVLDPDDPDVGAELVNVFRT